MPKVMMVGAGSAVGCPLDLATSSPPVTKPSGHWQPDDHSYGTDAHSRLANPRAAKGSAQTRERVLWTAFAVVFLVGLALSMAKNVLELAFILLAIALALVAVRIRK